jgi:integrase
MPEIAKILNTERMKRNPQIEKACKIALTTTARKSAIQNLRVEQINWNEGRRGLINFNNKDMKNKAKPRAIVPVPRSIESMLKKCCEESRFGWILQTKRGNRISDPLHILKQCVKDVGIDKEVCFHTLRHTGAVHMAKNSVPLLELSRYMGHTSIEITEKVYAKFYPEFMEKSSEIAGELINVH